MTALDFERIGRAHEILLAHRVVRSAAPEGRVREIERQGADLIRSLKDDEREALHGLLAGQGWDFHEYDDTMPGVARGGRVWMIVRRPGAKTTSLLTLEPAWRKLAASASESRATTTYWFTFIWLLTMSFMYERINRPISAVSEYTSAVVDRDELEQRVVERLELLRNIGNVHQNTRLPIAAALLKGDGKQGTRATDVRRRVGAFLTVMDQAGMIERLPTDEAERYRQTLLCAVQIDELYAAGLIHLVPTEQTIAEMDRFLATERSDRTAGDDDVNDALAQGDV